MFRHVFHLERVIWNTIAISSLESLRKLFIWILGSKQLEILTVLSTNLCFYNFLANIKKIPEVERFPDILFPVSVLVWFKAVICPRGGTNALGQTAPQSSSAVLLFLLQLTKESKYQLPRGLHIVHDKLSKFYFHFTYIWREEESVCI